MVLTRVIFVVLTGQALAVSIVRTETSVSADGTNTAESILAEVQEMAKSPAEVDKPKIQTIQDLANELKAALLKTHGNAEHEVDINLKAIQKCNDIKAERIKFITATTKKKVGEERKAHATCREQEIEKHEDMVCKCTHLKKWLDELESPTLVDSPPAESYLESPEKTGSDVDAMVEWIVKMDAYWCPKGEEARAKLKECKTATKVYKGQKAGCDKLQIQFELGFCTWRVELMDTCQAQKTCYGDASKAYEDHKAETEELIVQWKTEYVALEKILCYADVWLWDGNAKTVDVAQLKENCDQTCQIKKCQDLKPDATNVDVDFKTPVKKTKCSLQEVAKYPGTKEFKETEYKAFIDVKHKKCNDKNSPYTFVNEPTACTDEPTPPPTTTPAGY